MIRIGDAARRLGEEPSTLRYWEEQFSLPRQPGQRRYGWAELTKLRYIQSLLRSEGYTIEGAKKRLAMEEALRGTW